jgi:hypothetical protein
MSETPIVRRSRCGCVHGEHGQCLMVCSVHTEAVEGRPGIRLRTPSGELAFFRFEFASDQPPSEETLCGEEESFIAGSFAEPTEQMKNVAGETPIPEQLHAWAQHVRGVGRSRQKAYAEALSLAAMQFTAWRDAFPVAYNAAMEKAGNPHLNDRETQMLAWFSVGYQEFLREVQTIAQEGGR